VFAAAFFLFGDGVADIDLKHAARKGRAEMKPIGDVAW